MQSKNKPAMKADEREYVRLVKDLPCSVCDRAGPGDAHEMKQGQWWTSVALCSGATGCHTGPLNGLHGQRRMWKLKKMEELDALAVTIARIFRPFIGQR